MDEQQEVEGVEVPWEQLPEETLQRLIEDFVTRQASGGELPAEGLAPWVAEVRRRLAAGEIVVTFDPATESVDLVPRR